jgi:hypothetical protein
MTNMFKCSAPSLFTPERMILAREVTRSPLRPAMLALAPPAVSWPQLEPWTCVLIHACPQASSASRSRLRNKA